VLEGLPSGDADAARRVLVAVCRRLVAANEGDRRS